MPRRHHVPWRHGRRLYALRVELVVLQQRRRVIKLLPMPRWQLLPSEQRRTDSVPRRPICRCSRSLCLQSLHGRPQQHVVLLSGRGYELYHLPGWQHLPRRFVGCPMRRWDVHRGRWLQLLAVPGGFRLPSGIDNSHSLCRWLLYPRWHPIMHHLPCEPHVPGGEPRTGGLRSAERILLLPRSDDLQQLPLRRHVRREHFKREGHRQELPFWLLPHCRWHHLQGVPTWTHVPYDRLRADSVPAWPLRHARVDQLLRVPSGKNVQQPDGTHGLCHGLLQFAR